MSQETVAVAIVALAALALVLQAARRYLAPSLAAWLLKRGKVALAMKVHAQCTDGACPGCEKSAAPKRLKYTNPR
jgi:hypothetical protein